MADGTATLFPGPSVPATARRHPRRVACARWGSAHGHQRQRRLVLVPVTASVLVPASDHWGNWTFLVGTAAVGIWSEKSTAVGKALSGALVSVLVGLAASSVGVVAADAPAYRVVLDYLLPLAIPLLLFSADLRRVLRSTGDLLPAFLLGSRIFSFYFFLAKWSSSSSSFFR